MLTLPSTLATPLLPFLFDIYCLCHLLDVRPYASSLVFLYSAPFAWVPPLFISTMALSNLLGWQRRYQSFGWDSCCRVWFLRKFLARLRYVFVIVSSQSNWWCKLSIFPITCKFPFLQAFIFSWFGTSLAFDFSRFLLLFIRKAHFLCQFPFSYPDCIFYSL